MDITTILVTIIVTFAISYPLARHFAVRKKLCFMIEGEQFFDIRSSSIPEQIKLSYNDHAVSNVTKWKVGLWNAGNQPVEAAGIISEDPLKLLIPGYKILDIHDVSSTRDVCRPEVTIDGDDSAGIRFRILDKADSVVFTVLSEEIVFDEEEKDQPFLKGSIAGVPEGFTVVQKPDNSGWDDRLIFLGLIGAASYAIYRLGKGVIAGFYNGHLSASDTFIKYWGIGAETFLSSAVYWVAMFIAVILMLFAFLVVLAGVALLSDGLRSVPGLVGQHFELPRFSSSLRNSVVETVEAETRGKKK
ncbi:hypothetical protein AAG614_04985 [Citromicrobium bathyomarinum]